MKSLHQGRARDSSHKFLFGGIERIVNEYLQTKNLTLLSKLALIQFPKQS
jgi:hypothetical protein